MSFSIINHLMKYSLSTLRSICLKVGIQLVARDYDMAKEHPFKLSDIVRIFPVVKHYEPKSKEGHELLETGRAFYLQGRFDVAFDLLSESLNIFQQVYGMSFMKSPKKVMCCTIT
jgi:protein TIF31